MFDIGFFELALIALLALIVLGPERLPRAARTAGLWLGRIKRSVSGIQQEISAQLEAEELRQTLSEQKQQLDETLAHARNEARDVESGIMKTTPAPEQTSAAEPSAPAREPSAPSSSVQPSSASAPGATSTATPITTDKTAPAASTPSESREPRS